MVVDTVILLIVTDGVFALEFGIVEPCFESAAGGEARKQLGDALKFGRRQATGRFSIDLHYLLPGCFSIV